MMIDKYKVPRSKVSLLHFSVPAHKYSSFLHSSLSHTKQHFLRCLVTQTVETFYSLRFVINFTHDLLQYLLKALIIAHSPHSLMHCTCMISYLYMYISNGQTLMICLLEILTLPYSCT